jgi:hypothetical protein
MCIPRHLFLALASWLTVVFGEDIPFSYDDASDLGEQEPSSGLDLVGTFEDRLMEEVTD